MFYCKYIIIMKLLNGQELRVDDFFRQQRVPSFKRERHENNYTTPVSFTLKKYNKSKKYITRYHWIKKTSSFWFFPIFCVEFRVVHVRVFLPFNFWPSSHAEACGFVMFFWLLYVSVCAVCLWYERPRYYILMMRETCSTPAIILYPVVCLLFFF